MAAAPLAVATVAAARAVVVAAMEAGKEAVPAEVEQEAVAWVVAPLADTAVAAREMEEAEAVVMVVAEAVVWVTVEAVAWATVEEPRRTAAKATN